MEYFLSTTPPFRALVAIALATIVVQPLTAQAQSLTPEQARAAVTPFYDALNAAPGKDGAALVMLATAEGWQSCSGNDECKPREEVAKTIAGFAKVLPNLRWEIKELMVHGDRVIVRGEGSGTPSGDFMGVAHGGNSFKILAIDLHTVTNGKMVGRTYHVEDWMGATRQLRAVK